MLDFQDIVICEGVEFPADHSRGGIRLDIADVECLQAGRGALGRGFFFAEEDHPQWSGWVGYLFCLMCESHSVHAEVEWQGFEWRE